MVKYEGDISYIDNLRADFTAGILFGAVKFKLHYGDELTGGLYFLSFRIKTLDQIADDGKKAPEATDQIEENESDEYDLNATNEYDLETLKKLVRKLADKAKETWIVFWDLLKMSDKKMRKTIATVFKSIMKQLLPRNITGDFKFGLDDPYATAKILEIFTLLYAKMGDDLKIQPVWDNTCFLGELQFQGKIHITIILCNIFKLAFNSQFREIWREYHVK